MPSLVAGTVSGKNIGEIALACVQHFPLIFMASLNPFHMVPLLGGLIALGAHRYQQKGKPDLIFGMYPSLPP